MFEENARHRNLHRRFFGRYAPDQNIDQRPGGGLMTSLGGSFLQDLASHPSGGGGVTDGKNLSQNPGACPCVHNDVPNAIAFVNFPPANKEIMLRSFSTFCL